MAKTEKDIYEPKGITTSIRFTSRASLKINDNFFTVEACEERAIPDIEGVDLEEEKHYLWDAVNDEVDAQIDIIIKEFRDKDTREK